MSTSKLLSSIVLGAGLLAASGAMLPVLAQNASPAIAQSTVAPATLTIKQVYDKLESAGYTNIVEIERDKDVYEAKATDKEGQQVKVKINSASGEVIKTKVKSKKH